MVRSRPSRSAMMISSPIGVGRRSISSSRWSCGIGGKPQMLFGVSVPRPPGGGCPGVEIGGGDFAVPVAGRTHARPLGNQWRELRIAREMAVDGENIGAEVEYALHAPDHRGQGPPLREANGDGHGDALG